MVEVFVGADISSWEFPLDTESLGGYDLKQREVVMGEPMMYEVGEPSLPFLGRESFAGERDFAEGVEVIALKRVKCLGKRHGGSCQRAPGDADLLVLGAFDEIS